MTKVLVTGGAGFLGRGILRRVAQGDLDWEVTVYSRDEAKQDECRRRYPFVRYILGDVRDENRLAAVMAGHDWIIHTAAMKFVPEAELNAGECVAVNVQGSCNMITAAIRAQVDRAVGISSDKACRAVNVYGMSKAIMERLLAETASWKAGPSFTCVRYGNVIGSTGSVIPLFRRQYEEAGRVKITNPDMTRFWMSVNEAIDLILLALCADAGSILIPPARAMKIVDVARAVTIDDVEIEQIGERPGEKTHEELLSFEESVRVRMRHDPFLFELLPPGSQVGKLPFTIASHSPHEWLTIKDMRAAILDAKEV